MVAVTITANVLITDIVGSTAVLSRHGEQAAATQRVQHDEMVANIVELFHGEVVKSTGDGAFALLPSADLLVRAGAAISEAARHRNIELRVGAATGDVERTATDCHGEAAVVAARLCAAAASGQLLVAPSTVAMRGRRDDPPLRVHGALDLKGFDEALVASTLDEPDAARPTTTGGGMVVVGRDVVLGAVRSAWAADLRRVVVLSGEPGIGKTAVARALTDDVEDVMWIGFEPTTTDGFARWCAAIDDAARTRTLGPIAALGGDHVRRAAAHLPSLGERLPVDALGAR